MSLKAITQKRRIRKNPSCHACGKNIRALLRAGETVYSKCGSGGYSKYYCEPCKKDIFGGVKRRDLYAQNGTHKARARAEAKKNG